MTSSSTRTPMIASECPDRSAIIRTHSIFTTKPHYRHSVSDRNKGPSHHLSRSSDYLKAKSCRPVLGSDRLSFLPLGVSVCLSVCLSARLSPVLADLFFFPSCPLLLYMSFSVQVRQDSKRQMLCCNLSTPTLTWKIRNTALCLRQVGSIRTNFHCQYPHSLSR